MDSFPILTKGELDDAQRTVWDELTLGPRGFFVGGPEARRLPDLYNAWLQFPEFGQIMLRLADAIRERADLSGKHRELAILTTSILLNTRVEYEFHSPFARKEGLSDAVIAAIGAGAPPPFADDAERVVFAATDQLVRNATLTEETRKDLLARIGYPGLMQLIAVIGLYTVVSHTSNVAGVKLADDFSADANRLRRFFAHEDAGR